MAVSFPVLQRDLLLQQTAAVSSSFATASGKRSDTQLALQQEIAEPIARAAAQNPPATLLGKFHDLYAIKSGSQVLLVEEKWRGNRVEVRCYPPVPAKGFDKKKLENGDVADVYGKKFDDIPRIVLEGSGNNVDVHMNGKRQPSLEGTDWARGLSASALALVARARNAADLVVQQKAAATAATTSTTAKLLTTTPKPTPGPVRGHDLEGACSWRGQPVAVTSDRDGKALHVMIETRGKDGSGVWIPLALPDDARFPRRGCAVLLDGDTLQLVGGLDQSGTPSTARFTIDLAAAMKNTGDAALWKEKPPLKDAAAWAAAANASQDAVVVGGVASFYVKKNAAGDDVKMPQVSRALSMGGYPHWRDRSSAPSVPVGATAFVDSGCVFVGPGGVCDGAVSVYDTSKSAWFSLPNLPTAVGLGQLLKSGDDLVYAGGFDGDGAVSNKVFTLNLKDPLSTWVEVGTSDAVAGKARVVERDGKLVSLLVAPKGALMVHLE